MKMTIYRGCPGEEKTSNFGFPFMYEKYDVDGRKAASTSSIMKKEIESLSSLIDRELNKWFWHDQNVLQKPSIPPCFFHGEAWCARATELFVRAHRLGRNYKEKAELVSKARTLRVLASWYSRPEDWD